MTRFVRLSALRAAASAKPPGYLQAVMAAGRVSGDRIYLTPSAWVELRLSFASPVEMQAIIAQIATRPTAPCAEKFYDCKCARKGPLKSINEQSL